MSQLERIVQLQDLDLLRDETSGEGAAHRLTGLGLEAAAAHELDRVRAQLAALVERRWLNAYERARNRYGRGVVAVRDRVCQGCFITLPTSAIPPAGSPTQCESCGRILYWH